MVEAVSGMNLKDYFQQEILKPLGMVDTSYLVPESKFERLVAMAQREGGVLRQNERKLPKRPASFGGGGGLYSTATDYVRFMQMILRKGAGPGNDHHLQSKTVDSMMTNQIGALTAGKMRGIRPER